MFASDRMIVHLGASPALATVLALAHAVVAAVPWAVGLPWWFATVTSGSILALGGVSVARDALRRLPSSVVQVEFETNGSGRIALRSGRAERVRFGRDATVVPMAVVVRGVTPEGRSYGIVVTRDACGADAFRRLKVFLRWRLQQGAGRLDAGRSGP